MSRLFRGKVLAALEMLHRKGELELHGRLEVLRCQRAWQEMRRILFAKEWVVYAKPPFGGPEQMLKYLARYTHRVAISNSRILSGADGKVRFRWKDYARGNTARTMTLSAEEFLRRYLLHVLPKGFVRIRHYGFLSNRSREKKLQLVRELIATEGEETGPKPARPTAFLERPRGPESHRCPVCEEGRPLIVAELTAVDLLRIGPQPRAPP